MVRKLGITLLVISLLMVGYSVVYASVYHGTVSFSCLSADATGTGAHVLDRDNTGIGQERIRIEVTDGSGTLIYSLEFSNSLGAYSGGIGNFFYTTAPQYNPISFKIISVAGNGLPEQVDYFAQGECAGLPDYVLADTCVPLSAFTVVGDMPFETQAYYEPGKVANGVILNPGTYSVLGVDESGAYYKLRLACAYLWVPVDSMQPSFQPPQNGQPLPMEVVG